MRVAKKIISVGITLVLVLALICGGTYTGMIAKAETVPTEIEIPDSLNSDYDLYKQAALENTPAESEIKIAGGKYASTTAQNTEISTQYGDLPAMVWNTGSGNVSYTINVPVTAPYNLKMQYVTLEGNGLDIEYGIMIDGKYPFEAAKSIIYPRMWKNKKNEWSKSESGDDLTPDQVEYTDVIQYYARDNGGIEVEPYVFLLTKGAHTITLTGGGEPFVLIDLTFAPVEDVTEYTAPSKEELEKYSTGDTIVLQGEYADLKSSYSMIPKCDNTDVALTPSSAVNVKLNNIGGDSWSSPNSILSWNFKVDNAGYYKIGLNYIQNIVINSETFRWLKIDGKTPFKEAKKLGFDYDTKWNFKALGKNEDTPYYIWLDAGDHTISMEATIGDISSYYKRLEAITKSIGDLYAKIIRITGDTPDANRDYELFNAIPEFEGTITAAMNGLNKLTEDMQNVTDSKSTQYTAAMKNMSRVLRLMLEKPYIAHQYLSDYYSNYCTVSSWLNEMTSMPLAVDEIQIIAHNKKFDTKKTNIFQRIGFGIKRFLNTFADEYETKDGEEAKERIRIWVSWGRDQTQVLRTLIQDKFTAETGIEVSVEMVNATLIQGILSGDAPDVAVQQARSQPVNMGIRNALYDLKNFEDLDEVLGNFQEGAEIPYEYDGKLYALPDTQSYFVMFYRTDILDELGLKAPKTWNEFIQAAIDIQRNNMQVYVPYTRILAAGTVNAGVGNLNLYPSLLMQNGLELYNKEGTAAILDDPDAIKVFDDWTEFYTDYMFLKEADFYNRMRSGAIPLGIANYATYFNLAQAAPEIKGRWAVAKVPSINGKDHIVAGSGTGCSILETSKNKEAAWEFLKWWTSADTQRQYSRNVESILGIVARIATSNVEAFKELSLDADSKRVMLDQWAEVKEVPEVPGSYYLGRAVDQAFWQVVNGESNSVDAVIEWNDIANQEIERKIDEYKALRGAK